MSSKKRTHQEASSRPKPQRPSKKQRRQQLNAYHSSSDEEEENPDFKPVNLLDSDEEDIHKATVDDVSASEASGSDESSEDEAREKLPSRKAKKPTKKPAQKSAPDAPDSGDDSQSEGISEEEDEEDEDASDDVFGSEDGDRAARPNTKSKRNDPSAFANSLTKILSTKLSSTKKSDPVLSRSADAHAASKAVVDSALEAKARRQLREQKRLALEKGRVKDVLVATKNDVTGELETSTAQVLETERRLRKVAQRGVVKLFNAFRAAQVRGSEAESQSRKEGIIGDMGRKERVNEMSRKGFLDLIAAGGGSKKGSLEEA